MKQEQSEIWKDIKGYEGQYQVSSLGRVRSLPRIAERYDPRTGRYAQLEVKGGIRSLCYTRDGYQQLGLVSGGRGTLHTYRVHRLVAEAFIPNPDNLPEINHKNEIITDNRVENLEWCDNLYNVRYGTGIARRTKKLSVPVEQIDKNGNVVATYGSIAEAAKAVGVGASALAKTCKGNSRHQTAGGYRWRYKETSSNNGKT